MKTALFSLLLLTPCAVRVPDNACAAQSRQAEDLLTARKNEPVLLFFFSPDVQGASEAAHAIRKLRQDFPSARLGIVGVTPDDTSDARLTAFMGETALNFPAAPDSGNKLFREYKILGVPSLVLLDKKNRVSEWWPGYHPAYDPMVRRAIKSLLR